jgi:hypothetical protein
MDANERSYWSIYKPNAAVLSLKFDKVWKVVCKKYQPDNGVLFECVIPDVMISEFTSVKELLEKSKVIRFKEDK